MRELIADIKAFWQRGKRGWADRDCWSLDCYLAKVMADSIEHLRDTNHGMPVLLNRDPRDGNEKLWKAIQDVIIDGLRAHQKVVDLDHPELDKENPDFSIIHAWEEEQHKKTQAAFVLLGEYWGALWD